MTRGIYSLDSKSYQTPMSEIELVDWDDEEVTLYDVCEFKMDRTQFEYVSSFEREF